MLTFDELRLEAMSVKHKRIITVAAAEDEDVMEGIKIATQIGLIEPVLIGDKERIMLIADKSQFTLDDVEIIEEKDLYQAARKAVSMVHSGDAHMVMKGMLDTGTFLKAVLEKENGLRTGQVLSYVSVFEVPKLSRFLILTDCGMNVSPNLSEKVQIINNALCISRTLGIEKAKVAAICSAETVNPNIPATLDAAALAKMSDRGQIKGAIVDGPLALDNAISFEAARHKKINSLVAGQADIILFPNIESGNVMYKTLVHLVDAAANAGIIMGAAAPVLVTSRADTAQAKVNSIALGILAANELKK